MGGQRVGGRRAGGWTWRQASWGQAEGRGLRLATVSSPSSKPHHTPVPLTRRPMSSAARRASPLPWGSASATSRAGSWERQELMACETCSRREGWRGMRDAEGRGVRAVGSASNAGLSACASEELRRGAPPRRRPPPRSGGPAQRRCTSRTSNSRLSRSSWLMPPLSTGNCSRGGGRAGGRRAVDAGRAKQ